MLLDKLSERPFCIYGAGIVATSVFTALKALYGRIPLFFLVSDTEKTGNKKNQKANDDPLEIAEIPVKRISEWRKELQKQEGHIAKQGQDNPMQYLVAVPEVHHEAIIQTLYSLSIKNNDVFLFTDQQENELMGEYYSQGLKHRTVKTVLSEWNTHNGSDGKYNITGCREEELRWVYQAKSHMDKQLTRQYIMPPYVCPIQVGAAQTKQVITDLQDNTGDNISAKNRNYCELTATYYAWKNSHAAYKGICHYRRLFDISEEQMQDLLQCETEWDVILPYPSIHYPNISTQHTRYIRESDWNAMLQALGELEPAYLEAYEKAVAEGEQFFLNFNMLIAKAEVFDEYCSFLFRILARTEELVIPKGWERADRFAGYLGENLTTIYFLKNRERWKIAYAGKVWLT